jgi:hypothetical protein
MGDTPTQSPQGPVGAGGFDNAGFDSESKSGLGGNNATNFNAKAGNEGSGQGPVDLKSSSEGAPINPADLQNQIQSIGLDFLQSTDPIRKAMIDDSLGFLESDRNVTGTQQFGGIKSAAQQQFGNAEQNILENTASGGALTESLGQNQLSQANFLSQAAGVLSETELQRAQDLGFGGAQLGATILGDLQRTQAEARQSERNTIVQGKKGSGGTAGAVSGGMGALGG